MKSLSWQARSFIFAICTAGAIALVSLGSRLGATPNWWVLIGCCLLAAPLQVLKIEGVTARTSYNLGWIMYGFAFLNLGAPAAMAVMLFAHLVEWVWHRYAWYIQIFNIATFSLALWVAATFYQLVNPSWWPPHVDDMIPVVVSFTLLTVLNHTLVGCVIYLARNQTLAESGVMAPEAWLIDFGLLALGVIAAIVVVANPPALLLVSLVVFMLYRALLVPSLRRRTEVDPKTNVYNMRYFNVRMADELARTQRAGQPLTLVMADLDHLREINNSYGHLAGDIAINGVANILSRHCCSGHIVARFGGEEFAVLMPRTPADEAMEVVGCMRHAVEAAVFDDGSGRRKFQVTMSFGVTTWLNSPPITAKQMIEQADQALYAAKGLGRNCACLYPPGPEMNRAAPAAGAEKPFTATGAQALPPEAQPPPHGADALTASAVVPPLVQPAAAPPATAEGQTDASTDAAAPSVQPPAWRLHTLILVLTAANCLLATLVLPVNHPTDWMGIALFVVLAVAAELANIEVYARQTSVSTSAAALLAGVLLFGAPAALCIGPAIAAASWLKYRSPFIRFWFNANNHVFGGLFCASIVAGSGASLATAYVLVQVAVAITCAMALYFSSTTLVALAIALGSGQSWQAIWTERFRWLGMHYLAMGFVACGLLAAYPAVGAAGIILVLLPLMIIRYGQKQYISATEAMVHKLQQTNADLVEQKQAVEQLNQEMLDLLAASLDLRNPSVQSHSTQVARYATDIAQHLGLPEGQIEQVRRAALLHDVGKLAAPDHILFKPAPLSAQEYAVIQQHPAVGAALLERFSSFRPLAEFVLHHHEHYDGQGYPRGLAGAQIPLEARILCLADAVEAMASQRPYHPAMPVGAIKDELRRCSGSQFDPQIVDAFFAVLEHEGDDILVDSARSAGYRQVHEEG